jgi:hypothetical protein
MVRDRDSVTDSVEQKLERTPARASSVWRTVSRPNANVARACATACSLPLPMRNRSCATQRASRWRMASRAQPGLDGANQPLATVAASD